MLDLWQNADLSIYGFEIVYSWLLLNSEPMTIYLNHQYNWIPSSAYLIGVANIVPNHISKPVMRILKEKVFAVIKTSLTSLLNRFLSYHVLIL
jgi:hypothetical protein